MYGLQSLITLVAAASIAQAHTVITYPGWRGNNLHTNGSFPGDTGSIGMDFNDNGTIGFPYGMQWMYPCGGMPLSTNRTKWPVNGGAVSIQPGWFPGHSLALFYINIGINNPGEVAPPNMSHPVVPPFQLVGPNNLEYPGQFCIPQIGMPANLSLQVGQHITLQVIETAQHGAALYNCVDIELAEPEDVEPVTPSNCYNSTDLGFNLLFTSKSLTAMSPASLTTPTSSIFALSMALTVAIAGSLWI